MGSQLLAASWVPGLILLGKPHPGGVAVIQPLSRKAQKVSENNNRVLTVSLCDSLAS